MLALPGVEVPVVERLPGSGGGAILKLRDIAANECEALSVHAVRHWIRGNALVADLLVENNSAGTMVLPGTNPGGYFWDATLYDAQNEAISYSEGVGAYDERAWRWYLVDRRTLVTHRPRRSAVAESRLPRTGLA